MASCFFSLQLPMWQRSCIRARSKSQQHQINIRALRKTGVEVSSRAWCWCEPSSEYSTLYGTWLKLEKHVVWFDIDWHTRSFCFYTAFNPKRATFASLQSDSAAALKFKNLAEQVKAIFSHKQGSQMYPPRCGCGFADCLLTHSAYPNSQRVFI